MAYRRECPLKPVRHAIRNIYRFPENQPYRHGYSLWRITCDINPSEEELITCDEVAVIELRVRADELETIDEAMLSLPVRPSSSEQFIIWAVDYALAQLGMVD
ncbi:MAG: hypothetical protein WBW33_29405 [Bryobacteraceae bacterium]